MQRTITIHAGHLAESRTKDQRLPVSGQVLSERYCIEHQLGAGGFATVYAALDRAMGTRVAVKVLTPAKADPRTMARFSREIEVVRRLRHENTVRVTDHGQTAEGLPYLVMELLSGRPLDVQLSSQGPLSPASVQRIGTQVLRSLVEAHEGAIIHRDIKPGNLFLVNDRAPHEHVKVLDFGLAKSLDPERSGPQTTNVLCTPAYAAPERLRSNVNSVQTDIYALGVTMLELLQGYHPLSGCSVQDIVVFHIDQGGNLPVPPQIMATPLGAVIQVAVARDPAHRFANARSMLAAMQSLASSGLPEEPLQMPVTRARSMPGVDLVDLTFEFVAQEGAGDTMGAQAAALTDTYPPGAVAANARGESAALAMADTSDLRRIAPLPVRAESTSAGSRLTSQTRNGTADERGRRLPWLVMTVVATLVLVGAIAVLWWWTA